MFGILIVEDNQIFRKLLKETFNFQFPGLPIFEAADEEEAFEEIENRLPDLIFMDIRLQGKNSLGAIQKIKAKYPHIVLAVLTSYNLPEYEAAARQYKADYFLTKGLSTQEEIIVLVKSVLAVRNKDADDMDSSLPS